MINANQPDEVTTYNERSLRRLIRSITNSQGHFALILVRCNYTHLREQMVQQLREQCPVQVRELYLSASVTTLYTTIQVNLGEEKPQALMVFGLEQVKALDQVLTSANQVREEFRKSFLFPIVLWVTNDTLQRLTRVAPDFKSWAATSIKFEIESDELVHEIQQIVDAALTAILDLGVSKFLSIAVLLGSPDRLELEPALSDLQEKYLQDTYPQLEANLRFLIGREADIAGKALEARHAYEQGITFWQTRVQSPASQPAMFIQYGCVLFHLGLWWRRYSTLHPADVESACLQAKDYYQQGIAAFQQGDRPDLAAKFINALAEVLLRLGQWDEIETLAPTLVKLHQTYPEPVRLAYGYSFLAELALKSSDWTQAKKYAELALQTNSQPSANVDWSQDQQHYRSFYLLLLARSQQHLNQTPEAIANLEAAKAGCDPKYDPLLYIRILETLWLLRFEQGAYLEAFQFKQEQRSIEQQYGMRAFVGAGRLQTRRFVVNPAIAPTDESLAINQEIAASGRLQDIHRLVERISRADHKLTVIYGQSGVGKSSLVQAGLLPVLKQQSVDARDVIPVLLQVYSDWAIRLGRSFVQSFEEVKGLSFTGLLDSMAAFLAELRSSSERNLLTVLIFDQFEEFFFAYKDATQRQPFFEFLRDCLKIPYVKVILSLREDYLHYLLECNRLTDLTSIDNNILDKKILYYLGIFLPDDAKSVISSLTELSQFHLEPELIDLLVKDLAGDLGEVRPIELQVVGAQLQTEKINTLAQYEEHGPKKRLVGRFLEEVVKDCGVQNEQFAKLVLYLLTDENNTRPLKTRAELEADLSLEPERLDLILKILVKSGLTFQIPGFPAERYQLVHDYLVPFIRQEQSARLIAELEKEKEQRKMTEAKLNQALKQQLKSTRRATFTLAGLVLAISSTALVGAWILVNLYLNNLSSDSAKATEIERVQLALKTGRAFQRFSFGATRETRLTVLEEVTRAVNGLRAVSTFKGHTDAITSISFSPDERTVATASQDGTVQLWNRNGKLGAILKGHNGSVTSVNFSPHGQRIVTTGEDKTARLWQLDGTLIKTMPHPTSVTSAAFNSNGQMIAMAGADGKVRLWKIDGSLFQTLSGHTDAVSAVNFSSDEKSTFLAAAAQDDTINIWKINDGEYRLLGKPIENYGARQIRFSPDNRSVIAINKDKTIKFWGLDGTLLKNVPQQADGEENTNSVMDLSPNAKVIANYSKRYYQGIITAKIDSNSSFETFDTRQTDLTVLRFSPTGNLLASADSNNTVTLWQVNQNSRDYYNPSPAQIRYSSDGQAILTTRSPKLVERWSNDGQRLGNLPLQEPSQENTLNTFFTTEGRAIATVSAKTIIEIQSLDGGQPIPLTGFSGSISQIRYSPDGQTVAAIGNDNTLVLWQKNGTLIKALPGSTQTIIDQFMFSPDGQRIAAYQDDGSIHLWSSAGMPLRVLSTHQSKIQKIIFSPDSKLFVLIDQDGIADLWNRDGTLIRPLIGHLNGVREVLFSPDSQLLVSIGEDNLIELWDRSNDTVKSLTGHPDQIASVIFSPDSQILASLSRKNGGGESMVRLWNRNGSLRHPIDSYGINNVYFAPNSRVLASTQTDKTIRLWTIDGNPIKTLRGHNAAINTIAFSSDSKQLVSGSLDTTIRLWQIAGSNDKSFPLAGRHPDGVYDVRFSSDDKVITSISTAYSTSYSIKPERYSIQFQHTSQFSNQSSRPLSSTNSKDVDPADASVIFGSKDSSINTAIISPPNFPPDKQGTNSVGFSHDHRIVNLVSRDKNSNVSIQFLGQDGQSLRKLSEAQVRQVSFSPDGRSVVLVKDQSYTLRLWNFEGKLISTIPGLTSEIHSVSLSPHQTIALGNNNGMVELWNRNGPFIKSLEGHTEKVNSVVFSPDGKLLASASDDKTVRLWKSDGTLIHPLDGHIEAVLNVVFSPDGKTLVSSTGNETKLWNPDGGLRSSLQNAYGNNIQFNPSDSQMLLTSSYASRSSSIFSIQLFNGIWQQAFRLTVDQKLEDASFSSDGKSIAIVDTAGEVSVVKLDPEEFMKHGCDRIRDYLKDSPNVLEGDRHLCDKNAH